ncbi:hypothetical protein ON010_g18422 [Phytophthora cinnamomi]|nr:hypothetical protein ON010_g18422 [Phytophthora cinnamomi]
MARRYYHASKHPDETPLEYLYRLNEAAVRAKIPYADGTAEEQREHVELFINTLGSRLTLMEVPDANALEKKLRARQRGLAHQKKALFGSNKFRQKGPVSSAPPPRAVHAIHAATDGYDSGRECCDSEGQLYDFLRQRTGRNGFEAMQSHESAVDGPVPDGGDGLSGVVEVDRKAVDGRKGGTLASGSGQGEDDG